MIVQEMPADTPPLSFYRWLIEALDEVEKRGLKNTRELSAKLQADARLRRQLSDERHKTFDRLMGILPLPPSSEWEDSYLTLALLYELALYEHLLGDFEYCEQISREYLFEHLNIRRKNMGDIAAQLRLERLSDISLIREILDRLN
ncbi:hypothetical protein [Hyphobacterium sp.]|uniref:hypothetical protein n=1 Tax=Hyphobacterium sp. TaxID=2004662 RepID=UPI003748CF2A